jgi:predicted RNA-binding protein with PIN domain
MTLLIDGHNLIGTRLVPGVQLGDADDEWLLVQRLRSYAAGRRQAMTVVFDSGLGPAPRWQLSGGGVTVRFAPPGVEADALIVQLLRASPQPGKVTVVTNDQGLAGQVRAAGGQVRSATQFAAQLAPPKPRMPSLAEPLPDPRDPGFVDIYQGFIEGERDQVRFGAEIDLDAAVWIERLYGDDLAEAARAARWLGRFGGSAGLEPLLDALSHRAGQVRAAALLALADMGQRSVVPTIVAHLADDPSSMVREAAAQALGRLGGAAAEDALQAALADPKAKVRKAASASLAQVQARRL